MEQLPPIIDESWHQYLQPIFDDPKMKLLRDKVLQQGTYYPEKKDIFKVFRTPITDIKVVILGQDPYAQGEATGLAFAVDLSTPIPASLRIIKAEVNTRTDLNMFKMYEDACWKNLEHWEKQGVFLLNSALTVEKHNSGSHIDIWRWFTSRIVKGISIVQKPVWLLWGSKAKGYKDYITDNKVLGKSTNPEDLVKTCNNTCNIILEADHPAAETYKGSTYKFTGCNHFNLCNQILKAKGIEQIKW